MKFLSQLNETFTAITPVGYVLSDGTVYETRDELGEEEQALLDQYEYLQYYNLFGGQTENGFFFVSEPGASPRADRAAGRAGAPPRFRPGRLFPGPPNGIPIAPTPRKQERAAILWIAARLILIMVLHFRGSEVLAHTLMGGGGVIGNRDGELDIVLLGEILQPVQELLHLRAAAPREPPGAGSR